MNNTHGTWLEKRTQLLKNRSRRLPKPLQFQKFTPVKYFTVVRDPVKRVISEFLWWDRRRCSDAWGTNLCSEYTRIEHLYKPCVWFLPKKDQPQTDEQKYDGTRIVPENYQVPKKYLLFDKNDPATEEMSDYMVCRQKIKFMIWLESGFNSANNRQTKSLIFNDKLIQDDDFDCANQ